MKLPFSFIAAFFVSLVAQADDKSPLIAAYYYPWYIEGDWSRHEYIETPVLGKYGTDDPKIAEKHIDMAADHGIDCFFVSWWGKDTLTSNHLRKGFLQAENLERIQYGLYYETMGILDATDGKKDGVVDFSQPGPMEKMIEDFRMLKKQHFGHDQYLKFNDKPVVGFYVSRTLKHFKRAHLDQLEKEIGVELYSIGDEAFFWDQEKPETARNGVGIFDSYSAYNMFEPKKIIEGDTALTFQSREAFPIFRTWAKEVTFFPGIIPRYHDFRGHPPMAGTPDDFALLLESAAAMAMRQPLEKGVQPIVFITSFNEWWEGTSLEPAEEYGTSYLEVVRDFQAVTKRKAPAPLTNQQDAGSTSAKKPNVVFIITDDQSWDTLGFMGGKVHTPRIDQLAKDGLFLTNFNVTSTVCSPSRYSFLTGRYAGRCQGPKFVKEHPPGDQTQVENIGELEPGGSNLATILQSAGYHTGFVGKSHVIRHDWMEKNHRPEDCPLETYPQDADPRDPEVNAKLQRNHQRWCDEIKKYGFDFADGVYAANLKELYCDDLNVHNLEWTVSKACDFMDEATKKQKPFFLYFSTTLHHGPAPWANRFSLDADPRMTGEGFVEEGFDVMPPREDVVKRNREAGFPDNKAFALWLDDGVGALIDKVDDLGLEKDTMVVFVPDHGSFRHGKATLHEYGMRVPMLLRWPGTIQAGSKYDEIVANIDVLPTLAEICGAQIPEAHQHDGISFASALNGDTKPIREYLFGELGHSRCVKTKDWKYIAVRFPPEVQKKMQAGQMFNGYEGEKLKTPYLTRNSHLGHYAAKANPNYFLPNQLYDLRKDVEENNDVFLEHPEAAQELHDRLGSLLKGFPGRPFGEFTE